MKTFAVLLVFLCHSALGAIYGADSRRDISQMPPKWQETASAVAVALPSFYLLPLDMNSVFHEEYFDRNYQEQVGLCEGEKYTHQTSFGHCTAFLVHPKILVTAGHCLIPTGEVNNEENSYCENFSFWLGYNDLNPTQSDVGFRIPQKNVAQCSKVIYAINNEHAEPGEDPMDYAILELTEPVTHIAPIPLAKKSRKKGSTVATIGHPHGLPAKFSGRSFITEDHWRTVTAANLDTLAGNSGGPLLNTKREVEGVLISGHEYDTYKSASGCERINRCNTHGRRCKKDSDIQVSNLFMKVEIWRKHIDEYLEAKK